MSGKDVKFTKNRNCVCGQRGDVSKSHLHAMRRNPPFSILEIKFSPFCLPEFPGPYKTMGRKAQRKFRDRRTRVAGDCPQQLPDPLRIGNAGVMLLFYRLQRSAKINARVSRSSTGNDRKAKDLAAVLKGPMCGFNRATTLDAL